MPSRSSRRGRPLRVLVDRSRDSGCSAGLLYPGPSQQFAVTDSRGPVSDKLLADYDVATVCGYSPIGHEPEEIEALVGFVERGGGLLLASSTPAFERDVGSPASEMPLNALGRKLGVEFLSPMAAKGTTVWRGAARTYRREDVAVESHPALGRLPVTHTCLDICAPLHAPENAEALFRHRGTGEPLAVAFGHGEGRVVVLSDVGPTSDGVTYTISALVTWSGERRSARGRRRAVPGEIGPRDRSRTEGEITVHYEPAVECRVDLVLDHFQRLTDMAREWTAGKGKPQGDISVAASASGPRGWRRHACGALASDHMLASHVARRALGHPHSWGEGTGPLSELLGWGTMPHVFALHALRQLGYQQEAAELEKRFREETSERDPDGKVDIAREYDTHPTHPKSLCLALDLQAEFGDGLWGKTLTLLAEERDGVQAIPTSYASPGDIAIAFLSRVTGEDLYAWFAERGRTNHPVPVAETKPDDFKPALSDCLEAAARNGELPLSDRLDALLDWARHVREQKEPPNIAEMLGDQDAWRRLLAGACLALGCDDRSAEVLADLAGSTEEDTVRTLAALLCTQSGSSALAEALATEAQAEEPRFRLEAAYVLGKAGREPPPELTFEGMRSADGAPRCDLETEFSGYLKLWSRVDGRRVANTWGHPIWLYFPRHTPTLTYEVDWVHTASRWRRRGLSRHTLAEFLAHPLGDCCGSMMLGTGTRNVAHAMYRSFGFVDVRRSVKHHRAPSAGAAPVAEGVSFRPYEEGDGPAASKLLKAWYDRFLHDHRRTCRESELPADHWVRVALREGEMVGLIEAERHEDELCLQVLALAEGDGQEQIARSLLALAEAEALEQKCRQVIWWWAHRMDSVQHALARQGFVREESGGVWMWGVRNLPLLLDELRPLFEHRLKESDCKEWNGRVDLRSPSHRGRLVVEDGRVRALSAQRGTAELSLECSDTTLNKVMMGRETPFEAYLQTDLTIEPRCNDRVSKLLETLFPKVPVA